MDGWIDCPSCGTRVFNVLWKLIMLKSICAVRLSRQACEDTVDSKTNIKQGLCRYIFLFVPVLYLYVWTSVFSTLPYCALSGLCQFHRHLIACHIKNVVLCHCGSKRDQYCQNCEMCMCKWRQIVLNTCEETEALMNVAAWLSSCCRVCTWIMCKMWTEFHTHTISLTNCTCYDCTAKLASRGSLKVGGLLLENLIKF